MSGHSASSGDGRAPISAWMVLREELSAIDPDAVSKFARLRATGGDQGSLKQRDRELLRLSLSASTTHLWAPAVRAHMSAALDLGATTEQITETLLLTSVLGMHSLTDGIRVLGEELRERGDALDSEPLDADRQALWKEFLGGESDYWIRFEEALPGFLEGLLRISPSAFRVFFEISSLPWRSTVLDPLLKELMYVALDVSATHLYEAGLRFHLQNALKLGATPAQLVEVFLLAAEQGAHSLALGLEVLASELSARDVSSD